MIEVNLLPYRVWKRRKEKRKLIFIFFILLFAFTSFSLIFYISDKQAYATVRAQLRILDSELEGYRKISKEVQRINNMKKDIERKLFVLKTLDFSRSYVPYILYTVVKHLPKDDVWLERFSRSGETVEVVGFCLDQVSLSRFIRRLEREVIFQKVTVKSVSRKEENGPFRFILTIKLKV